MPKSLDDDKLKNQDLKDWFDVVTTDMVVPIFSRRVPCLVTMGSDSGSKDVEIDGKEYNSNVGRIVPLKLADPRTHSSLKPFGYITRAYPSTFKSVDCSIAYSRLVRAAQANESKDGSESPVIHLKSKDAVNAYLTNEADLFDLFPNLNSGVKFQTSPIALVTKSKLNDKTFLRDSKAWGQYLVAEEVHELFLLNELHPLTVMSSKLAYDVYMKKDGAIEAYIDAFYSNSSYKEYL